MAALTGSTGIDEDFAARGMANVGAWILGRNMFAPSPWPMARRLAGEGWWGENPPYQRPVNQSYVTPRAAHRNKGGTVLSFRHWRYAGSAGSGPRAARWTGCPPGGGVATIRQYLQGAGWSTRCTCHCPGDVGRESICWLVSFRPRSATPAPGKPRATKPRMSSSRQVHEDVTAGAAVRRLEVFCKR